MQIFLSRISTPSFNNKLTCLLSIPLNSSSFSSCSRCAPAMHAASSPSRCTTASPTPSRNGPTPPECSLRHRKRAPSSTTPTSPTAIASSSSAAASSPIPTHPSLSPTATPPSALAPSDCTFLYIYLDVYMIKVSKFGSQLKCFLVLEIWYSLHYTTVQLGTPGVKFMVALDTGSDLFWVPCECSKCASTDGTVYTSVCSLLISNSMSSQYQFFFF